MCPCFCTLFYFGFNYYFIYLFIYLFLLLSMVLLNSAISLFLYLRYSSYFIFRIHFPLYGSNLLLSELSSFPYSLCRNFLLSLFVAVCIYSIVPLLESLTALLLSRPPINARPFFVVDIVFAIVYSLLVTSFTLLRLPYCLMLSGFAFLHYQHKINLYSANVNKQSGLPVVNGAA
uniref:Uncharacterized protein n=1 Tax=Trypanosoma vivax (strain Y486) TaxID=1055687 RepID=G0TVI3_TRYVY|nr:hypothetical protein TVY486_0501580 [Trypanosoma vivax Y486]